MNDNDDDALIRHIRKRARERPNAHSVVVFFCTICARPHVALLDVDDDVIATFVVPDPMPNAGFVHDLNAALQRSAIERGPDAT